MYPNEQNLVKFSHVLQSVMSNNTLDSTRYTSLATTIEWSFTLHSMFQPLLILDSTQYWRARVWSPRDLVSLGTWTLKQQGHGLEHNDLGLSLEQQGLVYKAQLLVTT